MECESGDQVRSSIEKMPSVGDGWLDYQINPLNARDSIEQTRADGLLRQALMTQQAERVLPSSETTAPHRVCS